MLGKEEAPGSAQMYIRRLCFSPDDKYVVTGAGAATKGGKGRVMFLDKNNLEVAKELTVDATPVKVFWHSKINQVCLRAKRFQLL